MKSRPPLFDSGYRTCGKRDSLCGRFKFERAPFLNVTKIRIKISSGKVIIMNHNLYYMIHAFWGQV